MGLASRVLAGPTRSHVVACSRNCYFCSTILPTHSELKKPILLRPHWADQSPILMSTLVTSENVRELKREFDCKGGMLTLLEFVALMERVVLSSRSSTGGKATAQERLKFVLQMIELYKQIDVDGNQVLDWSEFTAFIVEAGLTTEGETLRRLKVMSTGFFVGERESRYAVHDVTNVELAPREDWIKSLVILGPPFNMMAAVQEDSDVIKMYDLPIYAQQASLRHGIALRHHSQFRPHRALAITTVPALSIAGGEVQSYLASTSIDELHGTGCYLWIWEKDRRAVVMATRVNTHNLIDVICWCSATDTLYASSSLRGTTIEAWTLRLELAVNAVGDTIKVLNCVRTGSLRWHSAAIPRLIFVSDNVSPMLASFSRDGTMCMWDVHTNRHARHLGMQGRGIRDATYCQELGLLATIEYGNICFPQTLEATMWRLRTGSEMPEIITTLCGHEHPIAEVKIQRYPEDLAHVITVDERGNLRRWCAHTFACLQVFHVPICITGGETERHEATLCCLQLPQQDRESLEPPVPALVLGYGPNIGIVESQPVHHTNKSLIGAIYNEVTLTFLTCTARSMRIWDVFSGHICRSYGEDMLFAQNEKEVEFTSCVLDDRKRKIITGDNQGRICVWNYLNGAKMKYLDPHSQDITSMLYIEPCKLIVTTCADAYIFVNDERDNNGYNKNARQSVLLRDVHIRSESATSALSNRLQMASISRAVTPAGQHVMIDMGGLSYSHHFGMLTTTSHIGVYLVINFWDFEYMCLIGSVHCPRRVLDNRDTFSGDTSSRVSTPLRASTPLPDINEILTISFLDPIPAIAFADDRGNIHICAIPPSTRIFKVVATLRRKCEYENDPIPQISCSALRPVHRLGQGIHLYAGYYDGSIAEWWLSLSTLAKLGLQESEIIRPPSFNGRRTLRNAIHGAQEMLPSRSQRGGLQVSVTDLDPTRVWPAHSTEKDDQQMNCAIVSLQYIKAPESILAASEDGTCSIWSISCLSGSVEAKSPSILGILDPDTNRARPPWLFQIDVEKRKKEKENEARAIIERLSAEDREQIDSGSISARSAVKIESAVVDASEKAPTQHPILRYLVPERKRGGSVIPTTRTSQDMDTYDAGLDLLEAARQSSNFEMRWRKEREQLRQQPGYWSKRMASSTTSGVKRKYTRRKHKHKSSGRSVVPFAMKHCGIKKNFEVMVPKSRSRVPRVIVREPGTKTLRDDGWVDHDDDISDRVSLVADDEMDMTKFLSKSMSKRSSWMDDKLHRYSSKTTLLDEHPALVMPFGRSYRSDAQQQKCEKERSRKMSLSQIGKRTRTLPAI